MTTLEDTAWSAHAEMLNRAADMERSAALLRKKAWELYAQLTPPENDVRAARNEVDIRILD